MKLQLDGFNPHRTPDGFEALRRDLPNGDYFLVADETGTCLPTDYDTHVLVGRFDSTGAEVFNLDNPLIPVGELAAWITAHMDTEDSLIDEFRAFCAAENLPFKSASDLRHHPSLTVRQSLYVDGFIERWDAATFE